MNLKYDEHNSPTNFQQQYSVARTMNNNCMTTPDSHTTNQAVNIETLKTPAGKRESKATQAKQKTSSTIPYFKSVALTDISLGGYRYKSKPLEVYKFACRGNLPPYF